MNDFMREIWHIITNETRKQFKPVFIWSIVMALLSVANIAFFDSLASEGDALTAALQSLPKALLEGLAIDSKFISSVPSYFNGNFMSVFLMVNALFAAYLINSLLAKRVEDGRIIFLFSRSISRANIFLAKAVTAVSLLAASNFIIIGISYLVGKATIHNAEVPVQYFVAVGVAGFLYQNLLMSVAAVVGNLFSSTLGLAASGICSFGFVIFDVLVGISDMPKFLRFLSPYYYLNLQYIADNQALKTPDHLLLALWAIGLFAIAGIVFRRREVNI